MKIKIINYETFLDNYEINIGDNLRVDDIKYLVGGDNVEKFLPLDLIYKNCVLNESRTISFYKIQENDEIWMGKIEDYLKNKDIIVDVFMVGAENELNHLIVKNHSTVADVVSMLQQIFPGLGYSYLWQTDGTVLDLDKSVAEIESAKGGHKIIFQSSNGTDQDFEECCKIHDAYLMEKYFARFHSEMAVRVQTALFMDDLLKKSMKGIIRELSSNAKLNVQLSSLPNTIYKSKFVFCMRLANRIFNEYRLYLIPLFQRFDDESYNHMMDYIRVALRVNVLELVHQNKTERTLKDVAIEATKFTFLLEDRRILWVKMFHDYFLLNALINYEECDIDHHIKQYFFTISIKRLYVYRTLRMLKGVTTARQMKKDIFLKTGTLINDLYFIASGRDRKPGENENLDTKNYSSENDKYIFEIIMNMEDTEFLRNLTDDNLRKVKLFWHKSLNKLFVIKMDLTDDSDIYRDIFMQHTIDLHVDAVKSIGLFRFEGAVYLGLEYMSEGSLKSFLEQKEGHKLSEEETVKITYQLLTQLVDIHDRGIMHRDIKPENIIFNKRFNAKLIDYGMSKWTEGLNEDEIQMELQRSSPGTMRYLAPEALEASCKYNHKADIWSLGVVVTEMVTGKQPYQKLNNHVAGRSIRKKKEIDVKLDSSHSAAIKDFVNKCLNPIPEQRPTASELIRMEFIQNYLKNNNN